MSDITAQYIISKHVWDGDRSEKCKKAIKEVRDYYEGMIDSGQLMVVKKATLEAPHHGWDTCSLCGEQPNAHSPIASWTFCPGCGAKIDR